MVATTLNPSRERTGYFYVWMAAACALVAFGGFAPTFWLQLAPGTFVGPPLLHIHGALFSAWTLLLLSQTWLAANGRLDHHRAWGLAGIALASAMLLMGLATAMYSLNVQVAAGYGDRARSFLIVPLGAIGLFAAFFAAAILNINRPDVHKRLMLLATFTVLQAAVARVFFLINTGGGPGARPGLGPPQPVSAAIGGALAVDLLVVAGMIYDWRTRGRPHPVWIVGLLAITGVALARTPLSATSGWLAFAEAFRHIAG